MSDEMTLASRLAPKSGWSEMGESDHFVQFYEDDAFLLDDVSRFVGAGLQGNGRVLVIATKPHRDGFDTWLRARGVDPEAARESGHYIILDATETLSKFMVNGWPDESRFVEVVGSAVARAADGGRGRLRAFGEMVALLWAAGNEGAALRLEELWNNLGQHHVFALFCAYPANGFSKKEHGQPLVRVCAAHSRVIPAESYSALAKPEDRLRFITQLQQKATALDVESAERKALEKSLYRREQELSDFFENAVEGLHQVDADGRILWANRAQLDLLGYQAEEYVGRDIADFHVHRQVADDMSARLLRGESLLNYPAELRCKDGSIKHTLIHSNGLWEDGKLVYSRWFIRDVTERKQLEAELKAKLEQLAEVDRRKDEFLAVLSHELRTPLNAMLGWVRMLRAGQLDDDHAARALEVIERSTWTQARLIDDLLDVSRIITGKLVLEPRPVSLIAVIGAALENVSAAAESRGVKLSSALDASSSAVWGDPVRLQQVMVNLLANGIKFTPGGGRVDVRLERDGSSARITVRDTGQGIRADFLPRIFDPFRQADSSSTRAHGGLGLGLAIVRNMVVLHKGTVEAQSAGEGEGSTFTVRLPLLPVRIDDEMHMEGAEREPAPGTARLDGVRVLIVDDDADTRNLLSWTLERAGAHVETAATATDGLSALRHKRVDLLLSDIAMPGLDGHGLIRHVRALPDDWGRRLPAIALTAFASKEDAARAQASGFDMHLAKPADPGALIQAIASLVESQKSCEKS